MRHYTVDAASEKLRLDQYLLRVKPDLTRAFIQKMIKEGGVFVNHKKMVKPAHRLRVDDELTVIIPSIKEIGVQPEKIPLDILYEDQDLIVINKPAGMVVHPTDHGAHVSGTLVNALMAHCKDLSGIGGVRRPGIVHRLDKETSGVMVVAKNDQAHHALARQFETREVKKIYVALLKGHLTPKTGSIDAPLLKARAGRKDVQISSHPQAKHALTHYEVKKYSGDYTLVEVRIVTGRTHQIRVHFAAIGYPVCGDKQYGDAEYNAELERLGLHRQFLHAAHLEFRHPKTNKLMTLKADLPKELKMVLKKMA